MEFKEQEEPLELEKKIMLMKRLPSAHMSMQEIERNVKNELAANRGEEAVAFQLKLINDDFLRLHSLRIRDKDGYFQMDKLLISESAMLILEVKNWAGTIYFEENGQVVRVLDGIESGFSCPVSQVKLQAKRLRNWLRDQGGPSIPIYHLVVFSSPRTILKSASTTYKLPREVIHRAHLPVIVPEKIYNKPQIITKENMLDIATHMCEVHEVKNQNVLNQFKINPSDIIKGIRCPMCDYIPMRNYERKWICHRCKFQSLGIPVETVEDYKLLFDSRVTNKAMREFLQVESRHAIRSLLKRSGSVTKRIGRGRVMQYEL